MTTSEDHVRDAELQYLVNPLNGSHLSDGIDGSSHGTTPYSHHT